jgi:hypothetical protein
MVAGAAVAGVLSREGTMQSGFLSKSPGHSLTRGQIATAAVVVGFPVAVVVIIAVLDYVPILELIQYPLGWLLVFMFAVGELISASLVLGGGYWLNRVMPPGGPRRKARIVIQILGAVFAALVSVSSAIALVLLVLMAILPVGTPGMF